MNLLFLGIGMILLAALWNFLWRPVMRDFFRDNLFDLRDDLRKWCLKNNVSLDSSQYHATRDIINSYLFYIDTFSFLEDSIITNFLEGRSEIREVIFSEIRNQLKSDNPQLNKYIQNTRERARLLVKGYMILRSFPLTIYAVIVSLVISGPLLVSFAFAVLTRQMKERSFSRSLFAHVATACLLLSTVSATPVTSPSSLSLRGVGRSSEVAAYVAAPSGLSHTRTPIVTRQ